MGDPQFQKIALLQITASPENWHVLLVESDQFPQKKYLAGFMFIFLSVICIGVDVFLFFGGSKGHEWLPWSDWGGAGQLFDTPIPHCDQAPKNKTMVDVENFHKIGTIEWGV